MGEALSRQFLPSRRFVCFVKRVAVAPTNSRVASASDRRRSSHEWASSQLRGRRETTETNRTTNQPSRPTNPGRRGATTRRTVGALCTLRSRRDSTRFTSARRETACSYARDAYVRTYGRVWRPSRRARRRKLRGGRTACVSPLCLAYPPFHPFRPSFSFFFSFFFALDPTCLPEESAIPSDERPAVKGKGAVAEG